MIKLDKNHIASCIVDEFDDYIIIDSSLEVINCTLSADTKKFKKGDVVYKVKINYAESIIDIYNSTDNDGKYILDERLDINIDLISRS